MKKWILSIVACATITLPAMAQQVEGNNQLLSSGDLYQGMSRSIPNGRVVLPYGLEVTFEKTVHLIFPAAIRYVDLGSQNIIAGKADDAENVLRVKAAVREFETETNMSVICEDGSFYAFNVKYADEPEKLSMEMKDFLSPTEGRLPSNRADIYFKELGSESPILVKLIMKSIYQNDKRTIKHVGAKQFGMRFLLRGLYAHNGLLYFHVRMDNESNMPYAVDFITFKVVDKKVAKHTAIQERILQPLRAFHQVMWIGAGRSERIVFALEQFTLSEDKQLEVTLYERNGSRTLTFYVRAIAFELS
ncbi:conjugative transposon protein TraN [Porphyromonas levii]|uniref:conjugative transposon protein TraN n=1 Tax=Porphyromonas levii TaxID=28114 RepID=UPI00037AF376|nr:conjugative transposon protein TraN [Porphyromonas levii]